MRALPALADVGDLVAQGEQGPQADLDLQEDGDHQTRRRAISSAIQVKVANWRVSCRCWTGRSRP